MMRHQYWSKRGRKQLSSLHSGLLAATLLLCSTAIPANGQKALQRFLKKCDRGDAEQCHYAGMNSAATDPAGSRRAYARACELGHRKGCKELHSAATDLSDDDPRQLPESVRLWEVGCAQDYGSSCTMIASALWNGDYGVPRNKQRAAKLWERACESGSRVGCRRAGGLFERGEMVNRDPERALAYYERSCDKGLESACGDAGRLMQAGVRVASSGNQAGGSEQAATRLRQACFASNLGKIHGDACFLLGQMLARGELGAKDPKGAFEAYQTGCRDNNAASCLAEGRALVAGNGVAADAFAASQPLGKACHLKSVEACREMCELQCKQGQPVACQRAKKELWPFARSCSSP